MSEKPFSLDRLWSKLRVRKTSHAPLIQDEQLKKKTIEDVAFEILPTMSVPEADKPSLYRSLLEQARDMNLNSGGFSRFVSANEAELFYLVFTALADRPVVVINTSEVSDLTEVVARLADQYGSTGKKPILIVKGFDQEAMDLVDRDWTFDTSLRGKVQNDGWVAFLQGTGRFKNQSSMSGSLSGSTSATRLYGAG